MVDEDEVVEVVDVLVLVVQGVDAELVVTDEELEVVEVVQTEDVEELEVTGAGGGV